MGDALRRARTRRGLSLDEAARDTRIRPDLLAALEDEDFERLMGDVYVRGSLRSYAKYLGLRPDKVVQLYARHAQEPAPPAPPTSSMGTVQRLMTASRFRDNQRLILLGAVTVLVLAVATGFVSRQRAAPPPAALPTQAEQPELDRRITAGLVANRDGAQVSVTVDAGAPQILSLAQGEAQSFEASTSLVVRIADGGSVHLSVSGVDKGSPGTPGSPWEGTFSFETEGTTSSPST
ncbi:MAG: helix-turn-helix domain-containing protein [Actinobacteria bacterium]|nr:helix-turn-helix domain-containing protein [Actinomycetota bacterium]